MFRSDKICDGRFPSSFPLASTTRYLWDFVFRPSRRTTPIASHHRTSALISYFAEAIPSLEISTKAAFLSMLIRGQDRGVTLLHRLTVPLCDDLSD